MAAENGPSFQGVVEKYYMTCSLLLSTETFFSKKVTQKLFYLFLFYHFATHNELQAE